MQNLTVARSNGEYKLSNDLEEILHLWRVELYHGALSTSIYVIASNEERAITQAKCAKNYPEDARIRYVIRVPFLFQGWSGKLF